MYAAFVSEAGATLNNSGVNGLWGKLYGGANSRLRLQPLRALDCIGAWQYNRPCAQQYVGKSQSCMAIARAGLRRRGECGGGRTRRLRWHDEAEPVIHPLDRSEVGS